MEFIRKHVSWVLTVAISAGLYFGYEHFFPPDHMFLDDETKRENERRFVDGLKSFLSDIEIEQSDREITILGHYEGRAVKVEIGQTFGKVETKTAVNSKVSLDLIYVRKPEPELMEGAKRSKDAFGERKEYLGSNIYIEGKPKSLAKQEAIIGSLPPDLVLELYRHMATHSTNIHIHRKEIEVRLRDIDVSSRDSLDVVQTNFVLVAKLAAAIEHMPDNKR